jgi:hypothetical protein
MRVLAVLAAMSALFLGGCATIIDGTKESVTVITNPPGATVRCDGFEGKTPATFEVKRGGKHAITISKEGYETQTITLNKTFNPTALTNIFLLWFWPIGIVVDLIDGALYKQEPGLINVTLSTKAADAGGPGKTNRIVSRDFRRIAPRTPEG